MTANELKKVCRGADHHERQACRGLARVATPKKLSSTTWPVEELTNTNPRLAARCRTSTSDRRGRRACARWRCREAQDDGRLIGGGLRAAAQEAGGLRSCSGVRAWSHDVKCSSVGQRVTSVPISESRRSAVYGPDAVDLREINARQRCSGMRRSNWGSLSRGFWRRS